MLQGEEPYHFALRQCRSKRLRLATLRGAIRLRRTRHRKEERQRRECNDRKNPACPSRRREKAPEQNLLRCSRGPSDSTKRSGPSRKTRHTSASLHHPANDDRWFGLELSDRGRHRWLRP